MNEPHLIPIVCKSKTGQIVTFNVAEIISIDGQPLRPEHGEILTSILSRLDALEAKEHGNG